MFAKETKKMKNRTAIFDHLNSKKQIGTDIISCNESNLWEIFSRKVICMCV